jgi:hypothetical protein
MGAVEASSPANTLTEREAADGWELLFDGQSTDAWRGFKQETMTDGWSVEDGALVRTGPGGDIVTKHEYGDFELTIDWQIATGGNSGIFFHVNEDLDEIWHSAPEVQILDDDNHPDGQNPETSAGSNYALHPPSRDVVRPVGEWNEVRLLVRGAHVEHWLNGVRVVEYELGSSDWRALVAASKFAEFPYGESTTGSLAVQDHGDRVAFRNIKVRRLD